MRAARLAFAERLDPCLVARPALVELLARTSGAERPFTELVEIALDHGLDVDPGPARAAHDTPPPAARVRDAGPEAPARPDAAFAGGIDRHTQEVQQRAAGEELAAALGRAEMGE